MNQRFTRLAAGVSLGLAAFAFAPMAQAALISYEFEVSNFSLGVVSGTFNGSFTYDDAQVPTAGFNGEDLYSLTSFTFTFDGNTYVETELNPGYAAVLGGRFIGLDVAAKLFSFFPEDGPFAAYFAYHYTDPDSGTADVSYRLVPNNVPEPQMAGLLAMALLGAGVARRRRALP